MKPFLLILGGSIGVGKTTLAYSLAQNYGNTEIIENDTIRRELLGFPLNYFMNHDLDNSFSTENNQRVDHEINHRTEQFLQQGKNVIRAHVDVSEHDLLRYASAYPDARLICLYLLAPESIIRSRLQSRKQERDTLSSLSVAHGHASDADENVLLKFPVQIHAPNGWTVLDASLSRDDLLHEAEKIIANS